MKNVIEAILFFVGLFLVLGSVGGLERNVLSVSAALGFITLGIAILIFDYWFSYRWW